MSETSGVHEQQSVGEATRADREAAREALREAQTDRLDSSAMAERLTQRLGTLTAQGKREFTELLQERRDEIQVKREQVERALEKVDYADSRAGRSLRDDRAALAWDAEHLETVFYVAKAALREGRRVPERGLER